MRHVISPNDRHMMNEVRDQIIEMGKRARTAARALAVIPTERKNAALRAMADALLRHTQDILSANAEDLAAAEGKGISGAMLERLRLTDKRVQAMADGVRQVADLPDPVGENLREWLLDAASASGTG